ncbi:MAG: hypothetical protein AB9903_03875 [Vulcanimicrobiota bacterium]
MVFVLSYEMRYYLRTIYTMGFGREYVVDWFGDGRCTIIHTWFVWGGRERTDSLTMTGSTTFWR